jgi:hypothetical protein
MAMIKPVDSETLAARLGYEPEDFTATGLSAEELEEYHANLGINVRGPYTFNVDSENPTKEGYVVAHDNSTCHTCTCPQYVWRSAYCKHRKRGNLVLLRRKNRRNTLSEKEQVKEAVVEQPPTRLDPDTTASLNRGKHPGFNLLRQPIY